MGTEFQAEGLSGGGGGDTHVGTSSPPVTLYFLEGKALGLTGVLADNLTKGGSGINSCLIIVQACCFL